MHYWIRTSVFLFVLGLLLPSVTFASGMGTDNARKKAVGAVTAPAAADAKKAAYAGKDTDEDREEPPFAEIAAAFRQHCVRVFIHGKSYDGDTPSVGEFGEDIRYERPTPVGGYWWDERHVILPDPVLADYHIRYLEVSLPGSDTLYPARVAGRFLQLEAMLLEVLPDPDGNTPAASPLEFVAGDPDDMSTLSYAWESGQWRILKGGGLGSLSISDSGEEMAELGAQGVLVNDEGAPVGLAFGDKVVTTTGEACWFGTEVKSSPFFASAELAESRDDLRNRLSQSVLEAAFRIRIQVEEEDEDDWSLEMNEEVLAEGAAEVRAPALVVGERHLLVPVSLPPEGIARIEEITVATADGEVIPADFVGAFRDYMAILIETETPLPTENLPEGFRALNPLDTSAAADPAPHAGYFQRWRVDYGLGRRREVADYDRWLGTFRGYRGDTVVQTRTNESDGSLAFDRDGRLVAVSLTPRLLRSSSYGIGGIGSAAPGFRPLAFIARSFRADNAFDPALRPVDEEQGQRLIDLGVEFQPLDSNTARLFHASRETRGGRIGLLVTHVYPGTMAADIGLVEHDVLLRLFVDGRKEPMELRSSGHSFGFEVDMASDAFQRLLRYLPPPWPSRDNVLSRLLTGAGPGRKVVLEYVHEGETRRAEFETGFFDPDYRNAKRERFPALGITVKPITYEVARYFGKPGTSGVIVSRVEEGGKGSVAGLHHYLLVTHVNGGAVHSPEEFRSRVQPFESGEARAVELTVEGFGKTRLVKIE